ncbi:hypothetical protein [Aquabacterium sp.]|uniref:hypothetical protein n=1 Tax=Aquabacterium sp. TaxID=1872578 RepID=UPI002C8988B4|nr:hypothetical protein [Aquabacterium sp.]HSW07132.1 hypothetical protein [Aquabacterium sp.]
MIRHPFASTGAHPAIRLGLGLCAMALLGLTGCATKDAVFVTKTSFSVLDVDATPAGISVAHDRVEGYFGPRFDNGHVYPVTGYFHATGSGMLREVQQVFAGGEAATVVLGASPGMPASDNCGDARDHPPLLFATGTTLGIKLGFAENTVVPTSFVFGYRRKEAAWVPVSKTCQPSVLASLDSGATARSKEGDPKLNAGVTQYFATGAAAVQLAIDPVIRGTFTREAQKAVSNVAEFNSREAVHNQLALDIFSCASKVPDTKFDSVVSNADELGVLASASDAAEIRKGVDAKDRLGRYARLLRLRNGDEDPRTAALGIHKAKVCKLAATS